MGDTPSRRESLWRRLEGMSPFEKWDTPPNIGMSMRDRRNVLVW
jgi:hypothetical protein